MQITNWLTGLSSRLSAGWIRFGRQRRTRTSRRFQVRITAIPALVERMEIRQLLSATSIVVTTSGGTIDVGQLEVLTATVTSAAGMPNLGSVTFYDGSTVLSLPIELAADGTATLTTTSLPSGVNTITATYSGGGTFDPSATEVNWNSVTHKIAGTGAAGFSGDGGPALSATMNDAEMIVVDSAGNVYFDDLGNDVVRRIDAVTHIITTYAGTGVHGVIGDGGLATSAQLDGPGGLAVDAAGNLYIADTGAEAIREVNAVTHIITTVAGTNNQFGFAGDGGPATSALIEFRSNPDSGIAFDGAGNLYIEDSFNSRIRKVDATTHIITTLTGDGDFATPLNNVPASGSAINEPFGITADKAGNVYIAMFGNRVSRVDGATAIISNYAGNGVYGYSGDNGPATQAQLAQSQRVAVDASGNLYIGDSGNGYVRRVDAVTHIITTVMGYSGTAIAFDSANNLYISGGAYNNVEEVLSGGAAVIVSRITPLVVATNNGGVYNGTAYPASATATGRGGIAVSGSEVFTYYQGSDTTGAVLSQAPVEAGTYTVVASFVSSDSNYSNGLSAPLTFTIGRVSSRVSVGASTASSSHGQPVTLTATLSSPAGTSALGLVDFFSGSTLLGSANVGSDGKAILATTSLPVGHDILTAFYHGNTDFVSADSTLGPNSIIQTIAGDGLTYGAGHFGDGGLATSAEINYPFNVVADHVGNIYVTDAGDGLIRKINLTTHIITTVAGGGTIVDPAYAGLATNLALNDPVGLAFDPAGNLDFSELGNGRNLVRQLNLMTGLVTTVAGNGALGSGETGDGGQATVAKLDQPTGIAIDAQGNLFIVDEYDHVVREVDATTHLITTVAGNGTRGYSGDGAVATSAQLDNPYGVAVDAQGNLFIADTGNNVVREVNMTTHVITTYAGTGFNAGSVTDAGGYTGDNGPATSAELDYPYDVAFDSGGNLFISDGFNNVIRKVDSATKTITTVVGNGFEAGTGGGGYSGDNGSAIAASMHYPTGIGFDDAGNLFIADRGNNVIRQVTTGATIVDVASASSTISLDTSASSINFAQPLTLTATVSSGALIDGGTVTFLDGNTALGSPVPVAANGTAQLATTVLTTGMHAITAVYSGTSGISGSRTVLSSSSIITTVAGNGTAGFTGNNVLAITAELNTPAGVAVDGAGDLFIADYVNNVVREVNLTTHLITTIAGGGTQTAVNFTGQATDARLNGPVSLAIDNSGNLFIADASNNVIRKVVLGTGTISTVAGGGSDNRDGILATSAVLLIPQGIAVDATGDLFIAEYGRNAIREVNSTTHLISTVAGNGTRGSLGDRGAATSAELAYPTGVAVDTSGDLFIADYGNNVVRKVVNGIITTVAGNHLSISGGDQVAATSVALQGPFGIAIDATGNLYIAETYNQSIRKVDATTQLISTFSGTGNPRFAGDNGPANAAQLSYPTGIAIDLSGDLFVADQGNNRIREIVAGRFVTVTAGIPIVMMPTAANLTSGSATPGGTIASDGGASIITSGVLYALTSVNPNPTPGGAGVMTSVATGMANPFATNVTGLLLGAGYSFVAFATNSTGIGYSPAGTFTTLSGPALSGLADRQVFVKGSAPMPIAASVLIANPNGYHLVSATVTITNWQGEDRLSFYNSFALQHTFSINQTTNVATLSFTGVATAAAYEATLQSLMYQDVNNYLPVLTSRNVSIVVNDGFVSSNPVSTTITFQNVDLPPLLGGVDSTPLTATGNGGAVVLSSSAAVFDPDSEFLTKLVVQITDGYQHSAGDQDTLFFTNQNEINGTFDPATGTLTLIGHSSLSNYRTALRSVQFGSDGTSINTATRTLTVTATDDDSRSSGVSSIPVTRHVSVAAVPAFSGTDANQTFIKGSPPTLIAPNLVISDSSDARIALATVTITNWQGEDRLSFYNSFALQHTFNVNLATRTATLTLTGNSSAAAYQATLRTVMYQDVNNNSPVTEARTATISVTDNSSNTAATTVSIANRNINLAPILSVIETSPLVYAANAIPVAISSTILVNDADSNNLGWLTVRISAGYQNQAQGRDLLSFVNQNGITGAFDTASGTLTLSGISSVGNYRNAVRSIQFSSSGTSVSTATRTLTMTAIDDGKPAPLSSNSVTRNILISQ